MPPLTPPRPPWRLTALAVAACLWAGPLAAAPLGAAPSPGSPAAPASPSSADAPLGCLIEPSRIADVGSALAGVLQHVLVDRGDAVRQGQVLAELRQEVERAQVDLAASHAHSKAELQGALKAWDYARKKQARTEDLVRKEFVSRQALEQTIAEAEVAQARLEQAREQLRHSARELELAHAQLGNRTLRSPISGIVVERFRQDGERVEDKPVLRIATLDPLRVEMVLPATLYGRVQRGTSATVRPDLGSLGPLQGRVSLVDRVIDAASNTFRARLELPNPGGRVPAGLRCSVQFAGLANEAPGMGAPAAPQPASAGPAATPATAATAALPAAPVRVARFADRYHPVEGAAVLRVARYPDHRPSDVALAQAQGPAPTPAVVHTARYPDRYVPVAGTALQEPAPLAGNAPVMALQPAAQLMAHLPPTAAGKPEADGPALRLALSRELAAPSSTSLAIALSR